MALKAGILPEYDHEMGTTRRLLERVPEADFAWKPHDKSYSLVQLDTHIASIPRWVPFTLEETALDGSTVPEDARPKPATSVAELLKTFDGHVKIARAKINEQPDAALRVPWTLKQGTHEFVSFPRIP